MVYIKEQYPRDIYETIFRELWRSMWEQQNDISHPDRMTECLSRHLPTADVRRVMEAANSPMYKQKLNDNTKRALDAGAFGCPWFEVTNARGEREPFFGSDR